MAPLPALTGTPGQIKWATDIRNRALEDARAARGEVALSDDPDAVSIIAAIDRLFQQRTESRWWITRKQMSFAEVLREYLVDQGSG
jgi:hypothetical protein